MSCTLRQVWVLVYINDMPDYVTENWTLALFADDSKHYKGVFNLDDHENLQSDLVPWIN